jgi:heptose-I-phosphate ethanolaminephosphotransferase
MGSHSSYARRYPSDYDVFSGKGRVERTLAEYHNSILYNDFIVDSLLNLAKFESRQTGSKSSLIYLSDHGENVYDTLDYAGHDYSRFLPDAIVEVPFLLWLSDAFVASYPAIDSMARQRIHAPFMTNDLVHALLDLNMITSPLVNPEKSLFNRAWTPDSSRILEDGRDYNQK